MENEGRYPSDLEDCLATDSRPEGKASSGLQKRVDRYSKAKNNAKSMVEYIRDNHTGQNKLIDNMANCGSWLMFREYYTIKETRLAGACTCKKHLLCQLCAILRGARSVTNAIPIVNQVLEDSPGLKPYMLTLTVKNGDDLSERYKHLRKALVKLRDRRKAKRGVSVFEFIEGAFWSVEVKRGKHSGQWHPHVHMVVLADSARVPSRHAISQEWQEITGDSYITDLRPIEQDDITSGFIEVFKYAVKFTDQPQADTWECYRTLNRKRLTGSFGSLYGVKMADDEITDILIDELPYIERFYKFVGNAYIESSMPATPQIEFAKNSETQSG